MENARDLPAPPNLAQAHKFSTKEDVALNLNVISVTVAYFMRRLDAICTNNADSLSRLPTLDRHVLVEY